MAKNGPEIEAEIGVEINLEIGAEIGVWVRPTCLAACVGIYYNGPAETQVMQYTTDTLPEHTFGPLEARPRKSGLNWCENKRTWKLEKVKNIEERTLLG